MTDRQTEDRHHKFTKAHLEPMAKSHVNFQNLTKTPVKLQKDLGKLVGAAKNMTIINLRITAKPRAHLHTLTKHLRNFKKICVKL